MMHPNGEGLISDASQITSNCQWNSNYAYSYLIDHNTNTHFHSTAFTMDLFAEDEYLQVDTKRDDLTAITLEHWGRSDGQAAGIDWHDTPTKYVVEGTNKPNDESSWIVIDTLDRGFPGNIHKAHYVSPVMTLDQPYRYFRFLIKNTSSGNSYWNLSEFQVYDDIPAYSSLYAKVPSVEAVVNALRDTIDVVDAHTLANVADSTDLVRLREAMENVRNISDVLASIDSLLLWAKQAVDSAQVGEEIGQFADQSAIDDLQVAVDNAVEEESTTTDAKGLLEKLNAALEKARNSVRSVEPGKFYYIISATADGDVGPADWFKTRDNVRGAAIYAPNQGGSDGKEGVLGTYNLTGYGELHWGLDDVKGIDLEGDPDAVFQFIPAPEKFGPRAYYIRNLRTGWYFSDSNTDQLYFSADQPRAFRVDYQGADQFHLVALETAYVGKPIYINNTGRRVNFAPNDCFGLSNRAAFTLKQYNATGDEEVDIKIADNTIQILTLPFAVKDFSINENAKAYGIHSIIDENYIGLVEKKSFAAGEPMVVFVGDASQSTHDVTSLYFEVPTELTNTDTIVNGLASSFLGTTLSTVGDAYIESNLLKAVTGDATIKPFSGYIASDKVVKMDGDPDAELAVSNDGVINKVGKVFTAIDASATVNVYTIDGQLIRKNVKAAAATKGLKKGVYIVGKKKVLVK